MVLHSCATSQFAQEISKSEEFKDVFIIAPDATLTSTDHGEYVNSIACGEKWQKMRSGKWHVYRNGKVVMDNNGNAIIYDANSQPGSKEFNYKFNIEKSKKK